MLLSPNADKYFKTQTLFPNPRTSTLWIWQEVWQKRNTVNNSTLQFVSALGILKKSFLNIFFFSFFLFFFVRSVSLKKTKVELVKRKEKKTIYTQLFISCLYHHSIKIIMVVQIEKNSQNSIFLLRNNCFDLWTSMNVLLLFFLLVYLFVMINVSKLLIFLKIQLKKIFMPKLYEKKIFIF